MNLRGIWLIRLAEIDCLIDIALRLKNNSEQTVMWNCWLIQPQLCFIAEHDDVKTQLDRKERECEAKIHEKEELMRTLTILKGKLESESKEKKKFELKSDDLTKQADELTKLVSLPRYLLLEDDKYYALFKTVFLKKTRKKATICTYLSTYKRLFVPT